VKCATILRWSARILSLVAFAFVAMFLGGGEEFDPAKFTAREWVGFALFPIGVCLGLLVAWFKEGLGALISLACLAAIVAMQVAKSGGLGRGTAFLAFAAPGLLFVASHLVRRTAPAGSR
jgi:hypothetical protein